MTTADKNLPVDSLETTARPDSTAARLGRFAIGSLFGITFMVLCFIMLTAALKGPDTIKVDGVNTTNFGLIGTPREERLKTGDAAPDFVLAQLGGEPVQLSKLLGKTVLINFWASWCAPCREEMPAIEHFYEKYKAQNVVVLAVNLKDTDEIAKSYFKDNNLKMPLLMDRTGLVPGGYRATGVPESYFVDVNGKVRAFSIGIMDDKQLEDNLQATWAAGGK